jgi:hypothetical protein
LYSALPWPDSIHLLQIEPGEGESPIICSLQLARLGTAVPAEKFDALSYTWGTPSDQQLEIVCDGEVRKVQCNLRDALHQIRLTHQSRRIWVDAVCIDQSNVAERSQQVGLMSAIYTTARNVIVWLGKDEMQCSADAFSVLCSVIKEWQFGKGSVEVPFYSTNIQSPDISVHNGLSSVPSPDSALWTAVSALFNCTWFWRVWVVQEVTLASSALVHWGEAAMEWRWVGLAATIIRTNYYQILGQDMEGIFNAHLMV